MSFVRDMVKRAVLFAVLLAFGLGVGAAAVCVGVSLLGWVR